MSEKVNKALEMYRFCNALIIINLSQTIIVAKAMIIAMNNNKKMNTIF